MDTQLNVFAQFTPELHVNHREHSYLFLANIEPSLQLDVLHQMRRRPELVALDTMNFWIEGEPSTLSQVVAAVDVLLINEGEARQLTNETNVVKAARHILDQGPSMVVIKRGEYGALGFSSDGVFSAPAYPLETVVDPTGAGDSFAGGFMGHLASSGDTTMRGYRKAMIVGSVMASFAVESFSVDRLRALTSIEVKQRFQELWKIAHFDELDSNEVLAHHLA